MLKIRLARGGKKHKPCYNIVVVDARVKRDGGYIEKIGFFNPFYGLPTISYSNLQKWQQKGAQMTKTVERLVKKQLNYKV